MIDLIYKTKQLKSLRNRPILAGAIPVFIFFSFILHFSISDVQAADIKMSLSTN